MKTSLVGLLVLSVTFSACQKQQTEEERKAEVEREVQNRLAAERQTQQQEQLSQREADLDAREKTLSDEQANADSRQASPPSTTETTTSTAERREGGGSYDIFYTRLEPYGSWFESSDYGYVWQPREAGSSEWRPYRDGHWVYTDVGWTWVSDERFGWATYHYGRWTRLRNVGWVWVPGDEWAPAWVSWRQSNDYVGWAPLPPEARFDRRSGIRNWADNYYDIGPAQYCFVPTRQLGGASLERMVVPVEQNVTIINRTTNVTNITYNNTTVVNQGPNYDELRSRTEQPIPRLKLDRRTNSNPATQQGSVVRGEVLEMPAPVVQRTTGAGRPGHISRRISRLAVDDGWAENTNTEAGREARAKMKAEATPPPDAPPKAFVKQQAQSEGTASTAASGSATPADKNQSGGSMAASASPSPTMAARPPATATPAASVTPTPSGSPSPTAGVKPSASPQPSVSAENEPPKVGGRLKSQAKKFNPPRIEPMPPGAQPGVSGAGAAPSGAVAPNAGSSDAGGQPIPQRREGMRRRGVVPPHQQPGSSPAQSAPPASAPPSPAASPSP